MSKYRRPAGRNDRKKFSRSADMTHRFNSNDSVSPIKRGGHRL